jgi:sulfur-carrier protein
MSAAHDPTDARPARVRLGPLLAHMFPDADRVVELRVATVAEMVDALEARWPGMRDCICDTSPAIRRHMNVFVEGRRATLGSPLAPGADVYVVHAISGG